ncbi:MAG: extracellular solute-binding protein [Clostridiales Family XIII bacterium]|nr:extracellular solute-binding protein [Clostridiales Family XIII bacterium]
MQKKRGVLLGFLILSLVVATACSGGGSGDASGASAAGSSAAAGSSGDGEVKTVTFANWAAAEESTQPYIAEVISAFEAENPNIKIDVQSIPVSDILKEVTIQATAGNAPDIAQISSDNVLQLQTAGLIQPLDDLLGADFQADLYPDLYDSIGVVDGKHYASPWANSTHGFFYNRKLLEQAGLDPDSPPKTIDELKEALTVAREKLPDDVILLQADTTVRTLGLTQQWPFLVAFNDGVAPFTLEGEVNFNTEGIKEYMEFMRWAVDENITLPGLKYGEFRPYAAQDKLLFGNDVSCFDGIVRSLNEELTPEILYETWGATALPGTNAGVQATPVQAHSLVIFEGSDVSEEAALFLEYLVASDAGLNDYIAPTGWVPAVQSANEKSPAIAENPIVTSFIEDVVPTGTTLPTGPDYTSYAEIIMTAVQQVITTDDEIQPILDDAQAQLEALF